MLPSLLQVMETAKVNRLNFERRIRVFKWLHGFSILYAFWRSSQDVDTPLPQAVDLTYHDEIRTLVESSNADSLDMVLKLRTLEDLLPAWTDEWRRTCDTQLKETFAPIIAKDATDGEVNFLDLASTVFGCGRCIPGTTAFHYPQVLEHRCLHKALHDYTMEPYTHGDECEFISTRMVARHEKWSCQNLEFTDTYAWAVEVITACGMDPNRATRQDMDALDVRLVCRDCPLSSEDPNIDGRKVMTWRAAVRFHAFLISHAAYLANMPTSRFSTTSITMKGDGSRAGSIVTSRTLYAHSTGSVCMRTICRVSSNSKHRLHPSTTRSGAVQDTLTSSVVHTAPQDSWMLIMFWATYLTGALTWY